MQFMCFNLKALMSVEWLFGKKARGFKVEKTTTTSKEALSIRRGKD